MFDVRAQQVSAYGGKPRFLSVGEARKDALTGESTARVAEGTLLVQIALDVAEDTRIVIPNLIRTRWKGEQAMKTHGVVVLIAGCLLLAAVDASAQENAFELLGIGGAGGMYCPCASPYDPDLMLICSDMSGSYRSENGGETWQMIDWRQLHTSRSVRPFFTQDAILWVQQNTLKVSRDRGVTWQPLVAGEAPWETATVRRVVAEAVGGDLIFVCTETAGLWRTDDGGRTWQNPLTGKAWDIVLLGDKAFVSVDNAFHVGVDAGKTWVERPVPAPVAGHEV